MIKVTIDKEYNCPEYWSDIPLSLARDLFSIQMPESLLNYYKKRMANEITDKVSSSDRHKVWPEYYGRVIQVLIGVTKETIDKVMPKDRAWFYETYCLNFILGLHFTPRLKPLSLEYIECDGEKLYLPKSREVLGQKIPMAYITAFEFTESADLNIYSEELSGGKFEVLANIISVLCRPEGEKYNEEISLKRAEKLKYLRMDYVWEVFFCFVKLLNLQTAREVTYLGEQMILRQKRRRRLRELVRGMGKLLTWAKRLKVSKKLKILIYGIFWIYLIDVHQ